LAKKELTPRELQAQHDRTRPRPSAFSIESAKAAPEEELWFDAECAGKAAAFFPRHLSYTTGEWAGRPFEPMWWQDNWLWDLYGWKRPDGRRRFSVTYGEIAKKNGKTTFAAGLGICTQLGDAEPSGHVYSTATDEDQASIVFDEAKKMVLASPSLLDTYEVLKPSLWVPSLASGFKPLSSKALKQHGLNPNCVIGDEMHAWANGDVWNALITAQAARRQPLNIAITNAGFDRKSFCFGMHDYAVKVRDGVIKDTSFLPMLFGADDDDDWTDPKTWAKANPSLGLTVKEEFLRKQCETAKLIPAQENIFRQFHLSQWTEQSVRWLSLLLWDQGKEPVDEAELEGRECYAALDLGEVRDLTYLIMLFAPRHSRERWKVLSKVWCPEDDIRDRTKRDRVPYERWVQRKLITPTPGNATDYNFVEAGILTEAKRFKFVDLAYDPWKAQQLAQRLTEAGLNCVEFRQGFASLSAPSKELERKLLAGELQHGGHEVLRWMAANVALTRDPAGNVKPDKSKSTERIDGIVALIMAIGRAIVAGPPVEDLNDVIIRRGGLL
jgi:phage terminase large subunit-like protein